VASELGRARAPRRVKNGQRALVAQRNPRANIWPRLVLRPKPVSRKVKHGEQENKTQNLRTAEQAGGQNRFRHAAGTEANEESLATQERVQGLVGGQNQLHKSETRPDLTGSETKAWAWSPSHKPKTSSGTNINRKLRRPPNLGPDPLHTETRNSALGNASG
jgi:hypothetical protein